MRRPAHRQAVAATATVHPADTDPVLPIAPVAAVAQSRQALRNTQDGKRLRNG